jgi:hypothetical protein
MPAAEAVPARRIAAVAVLMGQEEKTAKPQASHEWTLAVSRSSSHRRLHPRALIRKVMRETELRAPPECARP